MVAAILPLVLMPLMSLDLNAPYIFVGVCACCALVSLSLSFWRARALSLRVCHVVLSVSACVPAVPS